MKKLTVLLFLIFPNHLLISQSVIELIALDHDRTTSSKTDLSEINFKILSEHELITDTLKFWTTEYYFRTNSAEVRIEYENIFRQRLDTTFVINSNRQTIYLLADRMKDYRVETFIERSLRENKKWDLEIFGGSCGVDTNTKIELFKEGEDKFISYSSKKFWNLSKKTEIEEKLIKLNDEDISKLIDFEKKLRLLNESKQRCAPGTPYTLKYDNDILQIYDKSCVGIFEDYLEELIERGG